MISIAGKASGPDAILSDRALATTPLHAGNFFAVREAVGRLAAAGDYIFLNQQLSNPRNDNHEFVLSALVDRYESEESPLLSVLLYNYLVTYMVEIRNSNGEDTAAQAMIAKRIITRLLPKTGVSIEGLDFYKTRLVRQYLEQIRPSMERLRETAPGLPALAMGWSDPLPANRPMSPAKAGSNQQPNVPAEKNGAAMKAERPDSQAGIMMPICMVVISISLLAWIFFRRFKSKMA